MITSYAFMEGSIDKIVVVFLLKRWHPTNGAKADPFSEENRLQESKHGVTLSPAPWGGRGGGGGGGEGREGRATSYIRHSTDVRAEWPPFSALPSIWLAPFSGKSIWLTPFFWIGIWKAPLFWCIPVHTHIFRSERFSDAVCSLGTRRIDCDICLTTSNKWVQKSKGSIWMGQHFRRSSIRIGPFFQRPGIWMR